MIRLNKTLHFLLFLFFIAFSFHVMSQTVSYAYDYAGNRISRKIVSISNPTHIKKDSVAPAPVEDKLGERNIRVFPNPTKGALAVEITGGDTNDPIRLILFSTQGTQLQNSIVSSTTTPVNMASYPAGWYILRIQAGEKVTEFKIIKE